MKPTDVYPLLRRRFPANEYALMQEVRDRAGFNASRSADFIAVNLWPSRGLTVSGIELKDSRSDWLSELKKPEKAEAIMKHCDFFWLLTTDENIAKLEEIPAPWGWMCVKGAKIVTMKEPIKLAPTPLTRDFLCAMLKRAVDKTDFVHVTEIKDKLDAARESAKIHNQRDYESIKERFNETGRCIDEFQRHSGIDIRGSKYTSSTKKIGEIVRFLEYGGVDSIRDQLLGLEKTCNNVLGRISDTLELIKPKPPEDGQG